MQEFSDFLMRLWHAYDEWIIGAIKGLLILGLGFFLASLARKKTKQTLSQRDEILAHFFSQIIFFSIIILCIVTALGTLGVQTNSLIALLGTAGLAIALGLKDSLSNLASGIVLAVLRPFKQNDVIQIGSTKGKVEALNLFHTTLKIDHQSQAIIPNESITKTTIINYSRNQLTQTSWILKIESSKTLLEIQEILLSHLSAIENPNCPKPTYQLNSIQDQIFTFVINFWTQDTQAQERNIDFLIKALNPHFACLKISLKV